MNRCLDCKEETQRCWGNGMCAGGGHCMDCGGYNFADGPHQCSQCDAPISRQRAEHFTVCATCEGTSCKDLDPYVAR